MFDFGCGDGGGCDGGGNGGGGGGGGDGGATVCETDYTASYDQFLYNEPAVDVDAACIDFHHPNSHHHESTDVASYFDSWYSSTHAGDSWWRKMLIPILCSIIVVFILVFSFKVTKGSTNE